ETFAYAEGWDESRDRYKGLRVGHTRVIIDNESVLVKPEIALTQMQAEQQPKTDTVSPGQTPPLPGVGPAGPSPGPAGPAPSPAKPVRFHGVVAVDPLRIGRDAVRIAEEVVQHLTGLVGTDVEVSLEIRSSATDGFPENVVRTVTENCRTLKFDSHGFEKE